MEPHEVTDHQSLSVFVAGLRSEGTESWENETLDRYLEALAAWLADSPGYFANRGEAVPEEPSWMLIANMLAAARTYE
jgi:hypothetical protein